MPLIEGQVLEGKYEIVRLLARGGMGDVYLGTNRRIGKPVAIKVLSADLAAEPAAVERFEQEARVAPRIRSAHIAETYDLGELPSGERFIVMELLEGETLGARLEREERISERALAAITLQILDALASAHEAGVVHRDLKPHNVFLTKRDGRDFVKVVDFGVAKVRDAEKINPRLTVAGALVGTPAYMSPEQARGKGVDHRTDLYALGIILFEATLGAPPFEAENITDMLFRIALDTPPPLDELVPSVTPELSAIVQKALAKAADDRYPSAAAMREDVLAWQEACGPAPGARISSVSILPHVTDVATHTPRPWSVPSDDLGDAETAPRRRSFAGMAAMGMLAGLVVLGVTRPQDLRAMSSDLASRTSISRTAQTHLASAPPPAARPTPMPIVAAEPPSPAPTVTVATPPPPPPPVATTSAPAVAAPRWSPPKPAAPKAEPKAPEPAPPPPPPKDPEIHAEDTIY